MQFVWNVRERKSVLVQQKLICFRKHRYNRTTSTPSCSFTSFCEGSAAIINDRQQNNLSIKKTVSRIGLLLSYSWRIFLTYQWRCSWNEDDERSATKRQEKGIIHALATRTSSVGFNYLSSFEWHRDLRNKWSCLKPSLIPGSKEVDTDELPDLKLIDLHLQSAFWEREGMYATLSFQVNRMLDKKWYEPSTCPKLWLWGEMMFFTQQIFLRVGFTESTRSKRGFGLRNDREMKVACQFIVELQCPRSMEDVWIDSMTCTASCSCWIRCKAWSCWHDG